MPQAAPPQRHLAFTQIANRSNQMWHMPTLDRHLPLPGTVWGLVACLGVSASPAIALECPISHSLSEPGALRETNQTIKQIASTLTIRGSAAIPTLIFNLRAKYPHSTDAQVTNYMITAYCPVVSKKPALSEDQKRTLLEQFADKVRARLN